MCGLAGMIGNGIIRQDLLMYHDLMVCSQLRGTDGCGFYQVDTRSKYNGSSRELFRKSGEDYNFFSFYNSMMKNEKILDDVNVNLIMGHVRAATVGEVCEKNSHPFVLDNLVGAHNGTLKDKKYWGSQKTDSELMFEDMNKEGIIPVLESLDPDSAWALSIYDKKEKTITLGHNKHRPLAIGINEDRGVIYWASEASMLEFVLKRRGIKAKVISIAINCLITCSPQRPQAGEEAVWQRVELKIPEVPKTVSYSKVTTDWGEFWGDYDSYYQYGPGKQKEKVTVKSIVEKNKKKDKDKKKEKSTEQKVLEFKPSKKQNPKIHTDICNTCGKYLNLVEQYFAHASEDDTLTCTECHSNSVLGLPAVDTNHVMH